MGGSGTAANGAVGAVSVSGRSAGAGLGRAEAGPA